MGAVGSVFDGRWKIPCAAILLMGCCHAYAEGGAEAPARLGLFPGEAGGGCATPADCAANDSPWSGYLLGFKKIFGAERLISRLGLFGYGAAGHGGRDAAGMPAPEETAASPASPSLSGSMSGYMASLSLPKLSRNEADPRYGWGGLTYIARDDLPLAQGLKTRGVKYAVYVDECLRLEGLYGRSAGLGRYGVGIGQDNWSVALAGGAGDARMSLHVGYAIPLGASGGAAGACGAGPAAGRSFGSIGWLGQ